MDNFVSGPVVVVDDDEFVRESVAELLAISGYQVQAFTNGFDALEYISDAAPHVVLTDVNMPQMTGIELLEKVHHIDRDIPVILMSAFAQLEMAVSAIQNRAFDFIIKPFKPPYLIHAVEKGINFKRLLLVEKNYKMELERKVLLRTRELDETLNQMRSMSQETIERLTAAAELRDEETGRHIQRIGLYAKRVAEVMGMPEDFVDTIALASTMHDVGKIGMPDAILRKEGPLTPKEWEIMKCHTTIGGRILAGSNHKVLRMAASIALTHHEQWDGGGYPAGLTAEDIPLEGRIVMLVDQYDALRGKRVYKPAFDHDKSVAIITQGDGRTMPGHFDPRVLRAFVQAAPDLDRIFTSESDQAVTAEGFPPPPRPESSPPGSPALPRCRR